MAAMDPYAYLGITLNPDGSLTRNLAIPDSRTTMGNESADDALSKDIPLNANHNTSLRLFLPKSLTPDQKLPVIIYSHVGGFIFVSAASSICHEFCVRCAADIPAIIVSVDYRLAPEHRLPAAYDDAVDAIMWVRDQARLLEACAAAAAPPPPPAAAASELQSYAADPWLKAHADFTNCFIMGSSAGGNIAYHSALRALNLGLKPLEISGLILSQPFFSGVERTESESQSLNDKVLPLASNDLMWELALPTGSNRDHEYCNPTTAIMENAKSLMKMRCLVKGFVGDPLIDRMRELVEAMEMHGVSVVGLLEDEGLHAIEISDAVKAEKMVAEFRNFIYNH